VSFCVAVRSPDWLVLARSWSFLTRRHRPAAPDEQGTLGSCCGLAVGGHVTDVAVVIAEVCLRLDLDRLAMGAMWCNAQS